MSIEFKGVVKMSTPEVSGTTQAGKEWCKQDFLIEEVSDQYPNSIVGTNFNNKVALKVGDSGTFHLNAKANEYNGNIYNGINLWKVDLDTSGVNADLVADAPSNEQEQADGPLPF